MSSPPIRETVTIGVRDRHWARSPFDQLTHALRPPWQQPSGVAMAECGARLPRTARLLAVPEPFGWVCRSCRASTAPGAAPVDRPARHAWVGPPESQALRRRAAGLGWWRLYARWRMRRRADEIAARYRRPRLVPDP